MKTKLFAIALLAAIPLFISSCKDDGDMEENRPAPVAEDKDPVTPGEGQKQEGASEEVQDSLCYSILIHQKLIRVWHYAS